MDQVSCPDKRNESGNVAIHHRGWNVRQSNLQILQSFIDRRHLIRSRGSSPKLRDIWSFVGAIQEGAPFTREQNSVSLSCNTLIRRSMSRSELNKWGETRILPSRIATTTCSFFNS